MSPNLRKKAARGARRQSGVTPSSLLANTNNTPISSHHNTSEEDAWSETSGDTVDSWGSAGARGSAEQEQDLMVNYEDQVIHCIEELEEKRTSKREEALTKLIRLLSHRYVAEVLESRTQTLLDLLNRSIKKTKSYTENRLAAKVMSLMFITLGEGQETMFYDILQLLKYTITNTASTGVKSECINTLGLACFIAASKADALELLDFFYDIISSNAKNINAVNDGASITSALNAYGLLYAGLWGDYRDSKLSSSSGAHIQFERIMPTLMKQLESTIMEAEPDKVDCHQIDQLTTLLSTLATDSNRRRNKAERKAQRSAFRDILRTVEEGVGIEEKLKIQKQTLFFDTWAKVIQLNAFRYALAEGFSCHIEQNTLLQSIFEYVPPSASVKGSRPGSAMSFYGSDVDLSLASSTLYKQKALKEKSKFLKNRKLNKRSDFFDVG
ncbi:6847_t:CDS:2 [Ambispora gerdemannii]|uniref:6847_t:CDS:1 n=1 Tax=Ambispora gerdemannii TaxID=144530 RepID=A0A9N9AY56_9GLOM|nr:6847_t:CDS:2 [Ambispora gerdemannii]